MMTPGLLSSAIDNSHPVGVIPGRCSAAEASPESILPAVVMDSGLLSFAQAPE